MSTSPQSRRGFTLVEILVSISVLSLMLVAMSQITALSEQAWRAEQNRIDNFTKARAMMNLMTEDLEHAIFRGDLPAFGTGGPSLTSPATGPNGLPYYFPTSTTLYKAAFYTRQPGLQPATPPPSTPVRDVSLVFYNIVTSATEKIVLQRSDLYVPWTGGASNLVFQGDMTNPLKNVTAQEMAPGVVGFSFAFRRADGTVHASGDYTGYDPSDPVVAIDICLAVIGKQTLAELSPTQVTNIQSALTGAVSTTSGLTHLGIKAMWDQQTLPSLVTTAYPKDLGAGLKTFECWVACQPF